MTTNIGPTGPAFDKAQAVAIQSDGKIVAAGYSDDSNRAFALARFNADGTLDTSFGTGGKVTTSFGTGNAYASAVAIQSDGKIVVAGWVETATDSSSDFALARYNTDGTLDTSFGTGGKVTTSIGVNYAYARSVAIQSDGKVLAAGWAENGFGYDFALARYNIDGTLDTSFGTAGNVTTTIGTGSAEAYAVAIQQDGKIVAAGWADNGSYRNGFALARYNADGTLDASFGPGGEVTTMFGTGSAEANAVAIQQDGKIVAAGESGINSFSSNFGLARYNTDGTLDTSFGSGGKVTTSSGLGNDIAHAVAILSDGKIVAAGEVGDGLYYSDFALARYNTDGTLDTSFGTGGEVTTSFQGSWDIAEAVAIQPGGKVVTAGSSWYTAGGIDFALARFNTDGSLDTSFGTGGKVLFSIPDSNDYANAVAIQQNGKIIEVGSSNTGASSDFALARYNTDGSLDTSFGTGGKVMTLIGESSGANAVAIQSDGKIVVAGSSKNGADSDFALARYNTDGTLDTSFGTGGKVTTLIGDSPSYVSTSVYAVGIQSDGKIVVAGDASDPTNYTYDFALARYNTNGTLDTSFGTGGTVMTFLGATNSHIHGLAIQPDGRIVAAGWAYEGAYGHATAADFTLVRYNTNGTLDSSFGSGGEVMTAIGPVDDFAYAVAIQPDGKIVAAGVSDYSSDFALARYNANGTLDTSFGTGGKVHTPIVGYRGGVRSLALQPDGKIVAAGSSSGSSYSEPLIARFNIDGTLDASFGSGGTVIGAGDAYRGVAIQQDGRIVVATSTYLGPGDDFALLRYLGGPPDTLIDSGPTGTVSSTSANFTFHSTEGSSTFSCRLDSGGWGACTSPKSYTGLASGPHTFEVQATDSAGSTDPTAASRTWTISGTTNHTLTVTPGGIGAGTVTSSPTGINCGLTCSAQFASGTPVTLTATPSSGSTFSGWSGGGCSGTGTCQVTLGADKSVTATFTLNPVNHTLTVNTSGSGNGTVTSSPTGINCGSTCSHDFASGTPVALTATPSSGVTFSGWSGAGCSGTSTCQVTLSADTSVTAAFTLGGPTPVTVTGSMSGSYMKVGAYRYFHRSSKVHVVGQVSPDPGAETLTCTLYKLKNGVWAKLAAHGNSMTSGRVAFYWRRYALAYGKYRIQWSYAGDGTYAPGTSAWSYFKMTG